MTRREFLNNLYRRLGNLSREQAEQHLTYYAEMLADRMEEGMSEEEAVASMEDVDTIAQRILQDEGVPPVYPDPAPSSGGGREEDPPRKQAPLRPARDWRKPASAALWALAILAVVFAAKHSLGGFFSRAGDSSTAGAPSDSVSEVPVQDYGWDEMVQELVGSTLEMSMDGIDIEGFHIGSDGIWYSEDDEALYIGPKGIQYDGDDGSFYIGPGGIRVDEKAMEEFMENVGDAGPLYEVDAASAGREVDISWQSGQVVVQSGGGDIIQFQEMTGGSETLKYALDGDILSIKGGGSGKCLYVLLPDDYVLSLTVNGNSDVWVTDPDLELVTLSVNSSSGDVACSGLTVERMSVETSSGDILLSDMDAGTGLDAHSSGGDIVLSNVTGTNMSISATSGCVTGTGSGADWCVTTSSGDISLFPTRSDSLNLSSTGGQIHLEPGQDASVISIDTTSGDVELAAPDRDFCLSFNTSSGSLDQGGISLRARSGGEYWRGDGDGCSVTVNTTSGDLMLFEG